MSRIPATLQHYIVPASALVETRRLLRERGEQGFEAVVVWIGQVLDDTTGFITAAVRPGQVAYRSDVGCSVEVPPDALSELIRALPDNTFVLVRLHTHPAEAYHSPVDDTNMLISHNGAISIVVPYFARDPLDLTRCSVNQLVHGVGWVELPGDDVAQRFEIR
jgi:hypothetical protein